MTRRLTCPAAQFYLLAAKCGRRRTEQELARSVRHEYVSDGGGERLLHISVYEKDTERPFRNTSRVTDRYGAIISKGSLIGY